MDKKEQLLKDYVATYIKHQDWDKVDSLFPEFENEDKQLLKDYTATYIKHQDWGKTNSLFPEFFQVKKKEDSEPTSQESQLESPVQQEVAQDTLDTDAQKKVSESDISTGKELDKPKFRMPTEDELDDYREEAGLPQMIRGNDGVLRPAYMEVSNIEDKMKKDTNFQKHIQLLKDSGNNKEAEELENKYIQDGKRQPFKHMFEPARKKDIEENYLNMSNRSDDKYLGEHGVLEGTKDVDGEQVDVSSSVLYDVYGDLSEYGINVEDFNGFLEKGNDRIKKLGRAGYFTTDTTDFTLTESQEIELRETARNKALSVYISDRIAHLKGKQLGLIRQGNELEAISIQEEIIKTVNGYNKYVKEKLPNYKKAIDDKLEEEYNDYLKKETIEAFKNSTTPYASTVGYTADIYNVLKRVPGEIGEGILGAASDISAFMLDFIGADDQAEFQRMIKSRNVEFETNSLDYGVVQGNQIEHEGRKYIVTESGRIIDPDLGRDITAIKDRIFKDPKVLIDKAKKEGIEETSYSPSGLVIKGSNVMGNLALQIVATRGVGGAIGATGRTTQLVTSMAVQSGMVASSVYEETLSQLRDAGINDEISKGESLELAIKMGIVTMITSRISPNASGLGMTTKSVDKDLIKKLAAAYTKGGKESFKKTLWNTVKEKGYNFTKEGFEETLQELSENTSQNFFNEGINERVGKKVLQEDMSKEEVIELFLLSNSTAGLMALRGKTSSDFRDKLMLMEHFSKDLNQSEKYIRSLKDAGAISDGVATKMIKDITNYTKYSNKIPKDTNIKKVEPLLELLDKRSKLELEKKNLDKAFHNKINEEISSVDKEIDALVNSSLGVLQNLDVNTIIELQDKASKELSDEMKNKGIKNYTLTPEQINERAIEIYNKQKQVKSNEKELSKQQGQTTSEEIIDPKTDESVIAKQEDTETEVQEKVEAKDSDIVEANPKDYSSAMEVALDNQAKSGLKVNLQVDKVSEAEANKIVEEGGKLFMTKDGKSGAYVLADGYMGGLFKDIKSKLKNVSKVLQKARIDFGGKYFDAYATKLEDKYIENGFRPVARLKFNEEFAPEGWNDADSPLRTKPDVVFFAYDPNGDYSKGDGIYFEDYDKAKEYAKTYEVTEKDTKQQKKQEVLREQDEATKPKIQEELEKGLGDVSNLDLTNKESKSKLIETLEKAESILDKADSSLRKQGSETLGMNLPIVATRAAVKAMKAAVYTAKTGVEVIEAGVRAVKGTKWYENLSDEKRKAFDENAYNFVSDNVVREVGKQERVRQENKETNEYKKKGAKIASKSKKGDYGKVGEAIRNIANVAKIPLKFIPKEVRETFKTMVDEMYDNKAIPSPKNLSKLNDYANRVMEAVENKFNKIDALRFSFDEYVSKHNLQDKSFSNIIKKMSKDKESGISSEDIEFIKENKSSFYSSERGSSSKEVSTKDTKSSLDSIDKDKFKELRGRARSIVRNLLKLSDVDIDSLSNKDRKHLIESIEYFNSTGKVPSRLQDIINEIEANKAHRNIKKYVGKLAARWNNVKTNLKVFVKDMLDKPITAEKQRIKQADLASIDTQLNVLSKKPVFKNIFSGLSKAISIYEARVSDVANLFEKVRDKTGKTESERTESGMKITMFMLAKYKQSNPDVSSIFSVSEYVKSTINDLPGNKYMNDRARDMLESVYQGFVDSGIIDGDAVDVDAMWKSLSSKEKQAVIAIRKELDKQAKNAYDTNLYDGKNANPFLKDYFPLTNVKTDFDKDLSDRVNQYTKASFKSKNLQDLSATKAHPISFNPYDSAFQSIRGTMFQDYFMSNSRVINKTLSKLLNDGDLSRDEKGVVQDIKDIYEKQMESIVARNFESDETNSLFNELADFIAKKGFHVYLSGAFRSMIDLTGNIISLVVGYGDVAIDGFKAIMHFEKGVSFTKNKELRDFLINAKCADIDRFTSPNFEQTGIMDFDFSKAKKRIGKSNLDSKTKALLLEYYEKARLNKIDSGISMLHDSLITTPDTIVALPVWMGTFIDDFKKQTGKEPDLDKIANNDLDYFDKYHDVIEKASTNANIHTKRLASSKNKFMGEVAINSVGLGKVWNMFNDLFRSFPRNDFVTMREASFNIIKKGDTPRKDAVRLLAASFFRTVYYNAAMPYIGGLIFAKIASAMGYEKDDEVINQEDIDNAKTEKMKKLLTNMRGLIRDMQKDYPDLFKIKEDDSMQDSLLKSLLGSMTTIATGTGGNAQNYFWNQIAETVNYHYGEGITRDEGEKYNRFDNSVFRTLLPVDEEFSSKAITEGVSKNALGVYKPALDAVEKGSIIDMLGATGRIPFYKDMKSLKSQLKYKTVRGSKSWYVDKMELTISEGIKRLLNKEGISMEEMKKGLREQGVKEKDIDRMSKSMMELANDFGILVRYEEGN